MTQLILTILILRRVRSSNTQDEYPVDIRSQTIVKLLKRQNKKLNMEKHRSHGFRSILPICMKDKRTDER